MVNYFEIKEAMNCRGIEFTPLQFTFAFLVAIGMPAKDAYLVSIKGKEYEKSKDDKIDELKEKCAEESAILMEREGIRHLIEYLKQGHNRLIQEEALHFNDVEFTSEDLKKILTKLLKTKYDELEDTPAKEIIDLIKLFVDKFAPIDDTAEKFAKHFIQVYPPYNAVCAECGKEFDLAPNLSCYCPHCHHLYTFDKENNKFIY